MFLEQTNNIFFMVKDYLMYHFGLSRKMFFYPVIGIGAGMIFLSLLAFAKMKSGFRFIFLVIAAYLVMALGLFMKVSF